MPHIPRSGYRFITATTLMVPDHWDDAFHGSTLLISGDGRGYR